MGSIKRKVALGDIWGKVLTFLKWWAQHQVVNWMWEGTKSLDIIFIIRAGIPSPRPNCSPVIMFNITSQGHSSVSFPPSIPHPPRLLEVTVRMTFVHWKCYCVRQGPAAHQTAKNTIPFSRDSLKSHLLFKCLPCLKIQVGSWAGVGTQVI